MIPTRNVPNEYLLKNIIDEDFQAMLRPLNIFQTFFLIDNFAIVNNFITPKTSLCHYIASGIAAIIWCLGFVFRFSFYYESVGDFGSPVITFLLYFDLVFFTLNTLTVHFVNAHQSCSVVELIVNVQNALNSIKVNRKPFLHRLKIQNWISVSSVISVYIVFLFLTKEGTSFGVCDILMNFLLTVPTLVFDMDMVRLIRTIALINNELVAWNLIMEDHKKGVVKTDEDLEANEVTAKDMFEAYVDIVGAFGLCNKVSQYSCAFFGFQTFIHILANFEMILELGKLQGDETNFINLLLIILIVIWNLKNLMLLTTLSITCEHFYGTVNIVEATCVQILNTNQAKGLRRTCKNVSRLTRAAPRKLSACGVFELDATLPVRLLTALLAYTVVLLQFAFL